MEPFLKFSIGFGVVDTCQDMNDIHGSAKEFKRMSRFSFFISSIRVELSSMICNNLSDRGYVKVLLVRFFEKKDATGCRCPFEFLSTENHSTGIIKNYNSAINTTIFK